MGTYEKKYKEALERAKKELGTCGSYDCDAARQIFRLFPELKESKVEPKSYGQMEKCIYCQFNYTGYCNGTCILKNNEKKSAEWSEEDEHRLEDAIYFLDTAKKHYACTDELDACINWLKSLKQRMEE
jgi:hypothetical protein